VLNAGGDEIVDLDAASADGTIPVQPGPTKILLEHGVVVTFGLEPGGRFRTGDHWVFAARTADASVEALDDAPPRGIHAHYAKLALVTFPDAETDCRTLWPPERGGGGCECTVCVSPESHASGALTIAAAVQQVKEAGGTVCLAAGEYALADPVEIHDARSVRLRGQGLATVLLATGGGSALDVRRSLSVTIENLSVVASSADRPTDAIRLERCLDATLRRCFVLDLAGEGRAAGKAGAAVRLAGYAIGTSVDECVLAAETGIAGGVPDEDDEGVLVTASLRIDSNWLWCVQRGIVLGGLAAHLADTRITGNTIWGCRIAGVVAEGGSAAGPFEIGDNALNVGGSGIVAGVDAVRIAGNDVRGAAGDGIVIGGGLDPGAIDRCRVLGNRVADVDGAGIAIRTRVGSAAIEHNTVARTGGGGIELGGDGAARLLVVESNQLLDVARTAVERAEGDRGPYVAGMRFVAVEELDVARNTIDRAAASAWLAVGSAAILAVGTRSARFASNRLIGAGPREQSTNRSCGVEIVAPYAAVDVTGNTLRRRGTDSGALEPSPWTGLLVADGRRAPEGDPRPFVMLGEIGVAKVARRFVLLTATTAHVVQQTVPGDVAARDNDVAGEGSVARPVLVTGARLCELSQNRVQAGAEVGPASLVDARRAIVSANDLRGNGDAVVLEIAVREKTAPVLGNMRTGPIMINGAPLAAPWEPLNPLSAT
jgi:hypothetical protein